MRALFAAVLALAASAQYSSAQATWVVDALNRAGAQFTDIPPAVAAASPGDTILVRDGTLSGYSVNLTTSKGLTLLGDSGLVLASGTLRVTGLPAGQRFVVAHLGMTPGALLTLDLSANAGSVQLEDLVWTVAFARGVAVRAVDCAAVTLTRCRVFGTPALATVRSSVAVTESALLGFDASLGPFAGNPGAGIVDDASRLVLVDTNIRGGNGLMDAFTCAVTSPAQPGIAATGTTVTLTGTTRVAGGTASNGVLCLPSTAPDIAAQNATVVQDPGAVVAVIRGTAQVTTRVVPLMRSAAAAPGDVIQLAVAGPAGAAAICYVGLPGRPVVLPVGSVWLDPRLIVWVSGGVLDASGLWTFGAPLTPAFPRGLPLQFQAVLSAAGVSLSTPATTVLR